MVSVQSTVAAVMQYNVAEYIKHLLNCESINKTNHVSIERFRLLISVLESCLSTLQRKKCLPRSSNRRKNFQPEFQF